MEKQRSASTFEMLCDIIDKFAPCMNDYLYAYDITNDAYYISKKALDRFALPSNLFHDVVEAHNVFVYADDIKILSEDLKKMLRGEKSRIISNTAGSEKTVSRSGSTAKDAFMCSGKRKRRFCSAVSMRSARRKRLTMSADFWVK